MLFQDVLQEHLKVNFKINRKFPPNSWDLSPVIRFVLHISIIHSTNNLRSTYISVKYTLGASVEIIKDNDVGMVVIL